jgi:hypothetical protein
VESPHKKNNQDKDKEKSKLHNETFTEKNHETSPLVQQNRGKTRGWGGHPHADGQSGSADVDLEKLGEAFNKKELQTIPVEQLRKVHKVFIDSTAGATSGLGISPYPTPDPRSTP